MRNNKNTTSNLALLRAGEHGFVWGLFHKFHDIGPYTLVEYFPFKEGNEVEDRSEFHVYVNGEDCSVSAKSLEQGIITAIAHKAKSGQGMGLAACRVLNILGTSQDSNRKI